MANVPEPGSVERTTPVQFTYNHSTGTRTLNLRLNLNGINWSYELNTNVIDTFGGQVIQILGISLGELVIQGQFGREGPWGLKQAKGEFVRRRGVNMTGIAPKDPDEQFDYTDDYQFGIGLTQMMNFFREYFQISTQGGSITSPGRFAQIPMTLSYDNDNIAALTNDADLPDFTGWGASYGTWLIIPTEFPSYHRANELFAPEWQVTAQIVQVPLALRENVVQKAISRLHAAIGWKPLSQWSAPASDVAAAAEINKTITIWHQMLPNFTQGDVSNLIYQALSAPTQDITIIKNPDELNTATGGTPRPVPSPGDPNPIEPHEEPPANPTYPILGDSSIITETPDSLSKIFPKSAGWEKRTGYLLEVAEGTAVYAPVTGKIPHFAKDNSALPGEDPNPSAWEFHYDALKKNKFGKPIRYFYAHVIPVGSVPEGRHCVQGELIGHTVGKNLLFSCNDEPSLNAIIPPKT